MVKGDDESRIIQAVLDTWTPVPVIARIAGVTDKRASWVLQRRYNSGDGGLEYASKRIDEHNPTAFYRSRQRHVRILGVWMPLSS